MTVADAAQFYAPFAGLLAVVFWLGVLSQRVLSLEARVKSMEEEDGPGGTGERLVRLEVLMEQTRDSLASFDRSMQGVQRQLGNLVSRGSEFGA